MARSKRARAERRPAHLVCEEDQLAIVKLSTFRPERAWDNGVGVSTSGGTEEACGGGRWCPTAHLDCTGNAPTPKRHPA